MTSKCSLSSSRPISQPGFIQHKQEAFWFYSFLSIVYDHIINLGHWTEDMRDEALELADFYGRNMIVVDVGGGIGFTIMDQSPRQLAKAKEKDPLKECRIIEGDIEDLSFQLIMQIDISLLEGYFHSVWKIIPTPHHITHHTSTMQPHLTTAHSWPFPSSYTSHMLTHNSPHLYHAATPHHSSLMVVSQLLCNPHAHPQLTTPPPCSHTSPQLTHGRFSASM
ncbi:hypothetical protein PVL29_001048 [Vitis rotundifolia]|uniref:MPBQ/MBSQ family SAM-binding methyltransferase profile domain-containing protein n=1 Tax=Vitis rotundifolia TaxID=103349 RepID=A0AA39E5P8_VITRO|nr:hypothetical protein PVL29_001048 [Vitis rotundifolia]